MPRPSPLVFLFFVLSRRSRRCPLIFVAEVLDQDRLHWAGCGSAQNFYARDIIGIGIVLKRFLPVQFEDGGREKNALRVSQALIQINDNSHAGILLLLSRL
jgi:hypothetical protein